MLLTLTLSRITQIWQVRTVLSDVIRRRVSELRQISWVSILKSLRVEILICRSRSWISLSVLIIFQINITKKVVEWVFLLLCFNSYSNILRCKRIISLSCVLVKVSTAVRYLLDRLQCKACSFSPNRIRVCRSSCWSFLTRCLSTACWKILSSWLSLIHRVFNLTNKSCVSYWIASLVDCWHRHIILLWFDLSSILFMSFSNCLVLKSHKLIFLHFWSRRTN